MRKSSSLEMTSLTTKSCSSARCLVALQTRLLKSKRSQNISLLSREERAWRATSLSKSSKLRENGCTTTPPSDGEKLSSMQQHGCCPIARPQSPLLRLLRCDFIAPIHIPCHNPSLAPPNFVATRHSSSKLGSALAAPKFPNS